LPFDAEFSPRKPAELEELTLLKVSVRGLFCSILGTGIFGNFGTGRAVATGPAGPAAAGPMFAGA